MSYVTIILAPRGSGMSDMPVPGAVYTLISRQDVTTAVDSSIACPANRTDLFWFVMPESAAMRVIEKGVAVTASTGWYVPSGARWEAKATPGATLSLIAG